MNYKTCTLFTAAYFSLSQPSYEISEGAGNFNASVNLITDGQLEQDIEVVVEILGGSAFGRYRSVHVHSCNAVAIGL